MIPKFNFHLNNYDNAGNELAKEFCKKVIKCIASENLNIYSIRKYYYNLPRRNSGFKYSEETYILSDSCFYMLFEYCKSHNLIDKNTDYDYFIHSGIFLLKEEK